MSKAFRKWYAEATEYTVSSHLIAVKPIEIWQAAINWYKSDKARTTKQNALYWRRLEEIAQQANVNGRKFDSFCWHIYMKQHVMQTEFEDKNGRVITKYRELPDGTTALRSTKDMSKKAFNEYIERVVAYAVTDLDVKFSADYHESD